MKTTTKIWDEIRNLLDQAKKSMQEVAPEEYRVQEIRFIKDDQEQISVRFQPNCSTGMRDFIKLIPPVENYDRVEYCNFAIYPDGTFNDNFSHYETILWNSK